MAGSLRKTMAYLGLAEGDEDYDLEGEHREQYRTEAEPARTEERSEQRAEVTPISRASVMRESAPAEHEELRRIATVHPTAYNEARLIGEAFREGTPVIMNLTGMSESDAKRMVDFAAGLVFGLHGVIERVTNRVFLLSPATVEVAGDGSEGAAQGRFFTQS